MMLTRDAKEGHDPVYQVYNTMQKIEQCSWGCRGIGFTDNTTPQIRVELYLSVIVFVTVTNTRFPNPWALASTIQTAFSYKRF